MIVHVIDHVSEFSLNELSVLHLFEVRNSFPSFSQSPLKISLFQMPMAAFLLGNDKQFSLHLPLANHVIPKIMQYYIDLVDLHENKTCQ